MESIIRLFDGDLTGIIVIGILALPFIALALRDLVDDLLDAILRS